MTPQLEELINKMATDYAVRYGYVGSMQNLLRLGFIAGARAAFSNPEIIKAVIGEQNKIEFHCTDDENLPENERCVLSIKLGKTIFCESGKDLSDCFKEVAKSAEILSHHIIQKNNERRL